MPEPEMWTPLILVNLKTYRETMGQAAATFAQSALQVAKQTGTCIAIAPQTVDIGLVSKSVPIPVFAQHIDPVGHGKYTGHIIPQSVKSAGAAGTLINHSERRLPIDVIRSTVKAAWDNNLKPVVCVDTVELGRDVASFKPYAIAIEPPELIGSGIPVSKAKPEIVSGAVDAVKTTEPTVKVLCGAGITSGQDVSAAIALGAEGILVASGVVLATDPHKALLDLAQAAERNR